MMRLKRVMIREPGLLREAQSPTFHPGYPFLATRSLQATSSQGTSRRNSRNVPLKGGFPPLLHPFDSVADSFLGFGHEKLGRGVVGLDLQHFFHLFDTLLIIFPVEGLDSSVEIA